jgi:hypothetical protein
LDENEWNGNTSIQLILKDLKNIWQVIAY